MTPSWPRTAIVNKRPSPLAAMVGDEVVLFDEDQGRYFRMNVVGATIWTMLETPRTVGQLIDELRMRFQAGDSDLEGETAAFLEELRRQSLIDIGT